MGGRGEFLCPRRLFQPFGGGGVEMGCEHFAHTGVIAVEPCRLFGREQFGNDGPQVDGTERERLELEEVPGSSVTVMPSRSGSPRHSMLIW